MKIRSKVAAAMAAGALCASACGGSGGSSTTGAASSSSGSGGANLTWFMWTGSQQEVDAWKKVTDLVTQKYPNIHIAFQTTSFADYWTKLKTEAAGNTLPCLISLQSQRAAGFGSLFKPLDQLESSSHFDKSAFNPTIMQALSTDGSQRAIPYDFGPYLLYYNADMFKKAGANLPTPSWTMDDFNAAMAKLKAAGEPAYAAFPTPDWWLPWVVDNGGQYVKGGNLDITNPGVVKTFTWYSNLVHKEHYAPPVPSTSDPSWETAQFQAGNAAMAIDGPWDLINTQHSVKFTMGLAPLPSVNGKSVTLVAGSGFGISSSCKTPDAAWKAIQVMTGSEAEQQLATAGRAFAARSADQQYWYSNAVPGSQPALDAALKDAVPFRTTSNWDRVSQLLTQYGVPALNGAQSPNSVLQTVQSQASQ